VLNNRRTRRGCRAGRSKQRPIAVLINHRPPPLSTKCTTTDGRDNLIHIKRVTTPCLYSDSSRINVCCLNTRSVKNKTLSISDYVTSHDYDIMCLTETWLRSDIDAVCISEMVPLDMNFITFHEILGESVAAWDSCLKQD